jgi:hypothetical protein
MMGDAFPPLRYFELFIPTNFDLVQFCSDRILDTGYRIGMVDLVQFCSDWIVDTGLEWTF